MMICNPDDVPDEVRAMGFDWAAFLYGFCVPLNFIWLAGHRLPLWIGLLQCIPIVHVLVAVRLGLKGYEMAWRARMREATHHGKGDQTDIDHFRTDELAWQRNSFMVVGALLIWWMIFALTGLWP
jgi:hypothetical protein